MRLYCYFSRFWLILTKTGHSIFHINIRKSVVTFLTFLKIIFFKATYFIKTPCLHKARPVRILNTTHYHVTVAVLIVQWRRPADIKGARCCVAGVRRCRGQEGFPDSSLPRGTRYRENPTRHTGWTPPFSSVLLPRRHRGLPFAMTGSNWTSRCR